MEPTSVYTMDTISAFCEERNQGGMVEVDEELFYWFLEVLPPIHMAYIAHFDDGTSRSANFGFAEGAERVSFLEGGG